MLSISEQGSPTWCPWAPGRPQGPPESPAAHVLKICIHHYKTPPKQKYRGIVCQTNSMLLLYAFARITSLSLLSQITASPLHARIRDTVISESWGTTGSAAYLSFPNCLSQSVRG